MNNAGVLSSGRFLYHDLQDELNQLNLNTRAVLILPHHFRRRIRERRQWGGVIFLASTVAFAGVPGMSAYAASKAHALHFAEGFAREVRGDGIAVLALCPGSTTTEIWPTEASPTFPMRPEAAVEIALRKLGRRTTVVAGFLNSLITFSTQFAPRWMNSLIFGYVVGGCSRTSDTIPTRYGPFRLWRHEQLLPRNDPGVAHDDHEERQRNPGKYFADLSTDHSRGEECFYILEGEITFTVNEERVVAKAGTFANMPVGTPHSFKNESERPAKMLISVAPAGLEKMFSQVGVPLAEGATAALPPTRDEIEKLLAVAPKYGVEIKLPQH